MTRIIKEKDKVQIAFDTLEHVFVRYKNDKMYQSNEHAFDGAERVKYDLSEREKEHLALLRAHLTMEISEKAHRTLLATSKSSESLGKKVFWLNIVMGALTVVLATAAVLELAQ